MADLSESEANEALLVPQVKVAEDGSLIIDEERSEFTSSNIKQSFYICYCVPQQ